MKTKTLKWLALLIIIILINSCIPALYPLYTKNEIRINSDIEGTWVLNKGKMDESIWTIRKGQKKEKVTFDFSNLEPELEDKKYQLAYTQDGITTNFELFLVQLGENYFFDFYPESWEGANEMLAMHQFPVHTFAKVSLNAEQIELQRFDISFLEELIENNRIRIRHESVRGNILLTAGTQELQKFVLKYVDDPDAFQDPEILARK